ncbi:hypothetical protein [Actinoplanes sp. NPDC051859]|uniref:hypothetical protein n=1 Tax=Actinoplanes sp. NPDC051859 TaxID=3363909 RepID=UPI003797C08D
MSSRRRRGLMAGGVAGVAGLFLAPLPADAAPAPCEQAQRYSAQSGSQILRLTHLSTGAQTSDQEIHIGEAKSAMVAQAQVSSAAVARMIDAKAEGTPAGLTEPLHQQAPPTNAKATHRRTEAADVGPVNLGTGKLTTHAQWTAGMACGAAEGEVTHAAARLKGGEILDGELARVPETVESVSTTKVAGRGAAATTVAAAGLRGGDLELLDGAVRVRIVKPPALVARMSIKDGGEVAYQPAVVEVSGSGFKTERLSTAGDHLEITLGGADRASSRKHSGDAEGGATAAEGDAATGASGTTAAGDGAAATGGLATGETNNGEVAGDTSNAGGAKSGGSNDGAADAGGPNSGVGSSGAKGDGPDDNRPDGSGSSGEPASGPAGADAAGGANGLGGLIGKLPIVGDVLGAGGSLPLPEVPGVPEVAQPQPEGAPAAKSGTTIRIALGDVRQATQGRAIAARAAALSVAVAHKPGYGDRAALAFDMGMLEAAAVAPESVDGGVSGAVGGAGAGLPITGPRVDVIALSGVALLIAGAAAMILGTRGRSRSND